MHTVKIIILILGILISFSYIYIGFRKILIDGFKFNLKEVLGRKSITNSLSGNLIVDGLFGFIFVFILCKVWHIL